MTYHWLAGALAATILFAAPAQAQDEPSAPETVPVEIPAEADAPDAVTEDPGPPWRHGTSLMGDLKYPPGFPHFDYVNPAAPKGGRVRQAAFGTFDSFNPFIIQGNPAAGLGYIYESLMASSLDEAASMYGLIAEAVRYPEDFSWATFRLNPEARWHDGTPITPEDVVWSLNALKAGHPQYRYYYQHVEKAEVTGEREVTFTFDQAGNRELPQIVSQLTVLPKHWWESTDSQGNKRDITRATLERPLGSGPYRIKDFIAGRSLTLERVPDAWANDLPVNAGQNNFDEIRFEYFRDTTVALEAFRGGQLDYRDENSAKNWATAYDFPAAKDGRVVLETFPDEGSGRMQAFVFNLRREKFQDVRVRKAFNLVFNFEEMNRILFFEQYERISSYFHGTELSSSGLPDGLEKEILETVRDKVPEEVFTTPFTNPGGGDGREAERDNLREAQRLLAEAGWIVRREEDTEAETSFFTRVLASVGLAQMPSKPVLRNAKGDVFSVEFLMADPSMERAALFYRPALERLGIQVRVRTVDDTQYIERTRNRDYDIIVAGWPQSLSPGNEQLYMWGTQAADSSASQNYAGIKNPAVDELIRRVIFAQSREELVAATRSLDRVLLWNFYVVPQWTLTYDRTARWNRFSHPEQMPDRGALFPTLWWWDEAKAAKVGQ